MEHHAECLVNLLSKFICSVSYELESQIGPLNTIVATQVIVNCPRITLQSLRTKRSVFLGH